MLGLQVWVTMSGPKECFCLTRVRISKASSGWELHFPAPLLGSSVPQYHGTWLMPQWTHRAAWVLVQGGILLPYMWVECVCYFLLLCISFSCVDSDSLPPYTCLLLALMWHHLTLRRGVDSKKNSFSRASLSFWLAGPNGSATQRTI